MKAKVKEAIDYMVSTYESLQTAARGFHHLSAADVEAELNKAEPDTAEFVALSVLLDSLKTNPVIESAPEVTE